MNEYMITFLKASISFITLLVLTRLIGRKQVSQLTFFDYIVGITIGSIAANFITDRKANTYDEIIGLLVWSIMPVLLGFINLKSLHFRSISEGEPIIMIDRGKVNNKNMKKARYNIGDLLMQLRQKGVFDLSEVEFALLEPDGQISVLKKAPFNTVTASDMKVPTVYKGIMRELIINGSIIDANLKTINKDKGWLMEQLKLQNISKVEEVMLASVSTDNSLRVILEENISDKKS